MEKQLSPIAEAIERLQEKRNKHWDKGFELKGKNRIHYANIEFEVCRQIDEIISDLKIFSIPKEKDVILESHLSGQEIWASDAGGHENRDKAHLYFNTNFKQW